MKRLPDEAMPPLTLSPDEQLAVAQEAGDMVRDTVDAYRAFVASGRAFPKHQWRRVKSKEGFEVYRTRSGYTPSASSNSNPNKHEPQDPQVAFRHSSSASSSSSSSLPQSSRNYAVPPPPSLDRKQSTASSTSTSRRVNNFPILSNAIIAQAQESQQHKNKQFPVVVLTGFIPGTVEDAGYGSLADNETMWRLRSTYVNDSHRDCKILTTLQRPSEEDPFRYLGLKWAWRKLPAFVQQRDMVYAESTGMLQDEVHGQTGYNLMHSVELPGVPQLGEYGFLRMKVSLCYIVRPHDDKSVEIYCRAFLLPAGDLPTNIAALIYADALLATVNIMDCSTMKKLMWLTRQRRKFSHAVEPASKYDLEAATQCQGCSRSLKRFAGIGRSAAKCRCCKRVVCGKCSSERKIVLDVSEDGEVTQKTMPFCVQCVLEARALPALNIALATAVDWDDEGQQG
ncbi:hypothetical protein Gpo141_00012615 [Globisporangium polare]